MSKHNYYVEDKVGPGNYYVMITTTASKRVLATAYKIDEANEIVEALRLMDTNKQMLEALEATQKWLDSFEVYRPGEKEIYAQNKAALEAARGTGDSA